LLLLLFIIVFIVDVVGQGYFFCLMFARFSSYINYKFISKY